MKKNYFLFLCSFLLFGILTANAQLGTDNFTLGTDDASNYSSWTNGSNQGSGFGTWSFSDSGSGTRGHYLGSSGQGDPSFAIYSDGAGVFAAAERSLNSDLKPGDRFSVDLGHTSTIDGEIFIQLTDDGSPVFTLKFVGGDDRWRMNDGGSDFDSGQLYSASTSITFTFIYNDDGTYSYSFGTGSGSNITAVNTISGINGFKFQSTNQGESQNFGINNLSHTSKYTIPNGSSTSVTSNTTVPYLTVQSGGTVTVTSGFDLNVEGNISNNGTLNVNDGSLRVSGTSSGNVTYNRTLNFVSGNSNGWHLVSSPVAGVTFNDTFVSGNDIALGTGNNRGVATYVTSNDSWTYLQSGGSIASTAGIGYSMKRGTTTGTVAFTGTINTSDISGVSVSTAGNGFNLLGNPYTSYMSSQTFLNANSNTTGEIWTWSHGSGYTARTAASNFVLAPAQGFFVKVETGTTVDFAESNQASSGNSFQRASYSEVKLNLSDGTENKFAQILYYDNNTTQGFDWGYEGRLFGGVNHSLAVYTQLLMNDQGKKYQVQSLPNSEHEKMIVPVGVIADAGEEITFTAEVMNLPAGLKVFLEDRQTNTFTRLDEANTEYTITLDKALNDIGRFYLHTSASALSTTEAHHEHISVYTTNSNNLRIVGIAQGNASVKLYNIVGKEVLSHNFTSNGVSDITLPKVTRGIYIVQLNTEKGKLNKKIIID